MSICKRERVSSFSSARTWQYLMVASSWLATPMSHWLTAGVTVAVFINSSIWAELKLEIPSHSFAFVHVYMRANVRAGASKRARKSGYCSLFQCSQQCPKERARVIFLYPRVVCTAHHLISELQVGLKAMEWGRAVV